jgi:AcrR family transcriptional regulator
MKTTSSNQRLRTFSKQTASVRRKQLIEATFRCLCMYGVGDTSVRTIAAEANLSLGMVRHHFNSKDELLAETYRYLSERLQEQVREAMAEADPTPIAQLKAFIYAGLRPPLLNHEYVRIRFLFWELTHTNPLIKQVHHEVYRRFENRLLELVVTVARSKGIELDFQFLTLTIAAFLKGVWAEWTLANDNFDPRKLVDQLWPVLEYVLDNDPPKAALVHPA